MTEGLVSLVRPENDTRKSYSKLQGIINSTKERPLVALFEIL